MVFLSYAIEGLFYCIGSKHDMTHFEAVRNLVVLIIWPYFATLCFTAQVLYSASMHICAPHLTGSKRLPYIAGGPGLLGIVPTSNM